MAQIVVRGIEDGLMQKFKEQAKQRGKSAEQAVRELIENAARAAQRSDNWFEEVKAFGDRLREKYGVSDVTSAELIREGRDER